MSARAAWRLESLGFPQVYRYTAGKADWFAAGLPREGTQAHTPRAAGAARRDTPTCRLTDTVGDVRDAVRAAGWELCIVVNEARIVLGRLRKDAFAADRQTHVEAVMEAGPTTFRPDVPLDELTERLRTRHVQSVVVSTSDGELIGVLFRDEAEQRLQREPATTTATT